MKPATAPLPPSPVPHEILDEGETLTAAFASIATRFPSFQCLAMVGHDDREVRLTVGELWAHAREIQAGVMAHGLQPGEIGLIALPTGLDLVAAYFGIMLAGGIPALVATPSHRLAGRSAYGEHLARLADTAQAAFLVADDAVAAIVQERGGVGRAKVLTLISVRGRPQVAPIVAGPDDVATLQFSSGSTAAPKGVLVTHRAVLNNFRAIRHALAITRDDVSVSWAPLYHDMGLFDGLLLPLLSGCRTVLVPTMDFIREPSSWLRAVQRYRGTLSWAPNFAYALCVKRIPDRALAGLDLSSWRVAASGAEPVLAQTVEEFAARFAACGYRPEAMTPIYGMAENVTIATAHALSDRPRIEVLDRTRLAADDVAQPTTDPGTSCVSVGKPLPGCTVEIRDPTGRPLPERRVGTIWLRSDSLCTGYHRDPAATAAALVDSWFNSGDRGYLADGDLYFVSREKDLIVIAGEKYAPHDIEAVIGAVPGVREGCAVVFGVVNPERGTEDLAAIIETKVDGDGLVALRTAVRAEVSRRTGLALHTLLLVPPGGIEKTSSGKLARRATQRRYADRLV